MLRFSHLQFHKVDECVSTNGGYIYVCVYGLIGWFIYYFLFLESRGVANLSAGLDKSLLTKYGDSLWIIYPRVYSEAIREIDSAIYKRKLNIWEISSDGNVKFPK